MDNQRAIIILSLVVVVAIAVYYCSPKSKETFFNVAGVDHLGPIDDSYDRTMLPDEVAPAEVFADIVGNGDQMELVEDLVAQDPSSLQNLRPMQRLHRLQGSQLLPKTSKSLTPYNIDIADPATFSFILSAPRVVLKDRVWLNSDKFRGDIGISSGGYCMAGRSSFGRDSQNLSGFFSDGYAALYNKYTATGSNRNMPMMVSNEETIMDYM